MFCNVVSIYIYVINVYIRFNMLYDSKIDI